EQRTDTFRARLELWDAVRGRTIASSTFVIPISQPFALLDRMHREATRMLRLPERDGDAATFCGVRGAGTIRYLLQGLGRFRSAATAEQWRGAVDELELACNTEPEAGTPRAWLSEAQLNCYGADGDRAWLDRAELSARIALDRDSTRVEGFRSLGYVLSTKN